MKIKPKEEIKQSDASIDALKSMTAALTLSTPATIVSQLLVFPAERLCSTVEEVQHCGGCSVL